MHVAAHAPSCPAMNDTSKAPRERFVFIRPGALGDALLTLPTLALLRRARPMAHVTFVARADVLPLALASALADAVSPYDSPTWAGLFSDDPASYPETREILSGARVITYLADPDGTVGRNLSQLGAARSVIVPGRPPDSGPHAALHIANALTSFDVAIPRELDGLIAALPRLLPPHTSEERAERAWRALGMPEDRSVLAIHPGSGGDAKRWPAERFAAVYREALTLGLTPLLIEGPADAPTTEAVLAELGAPPPVARHLTVDALLALLRRCSVYLGNDSGVTHLAAFAGARVLALFGPTTPDLWSPLAANAVVLRSPTGRMDALSVEAVIAALRMVATSATGREQSATQ